MPDITILTSHGLKRLQDELEILKKKRRPEIAERINAAKEYGDLSENAEYHDAKEEQSFAEGRILEIEQILKTAKVVDKRNSDEVDVGSKVMLIKNGEKIIFDIVGATEADPAQGKISVESPLAQALSGHVVGDSVEVKTPGGTVTYEIKEIS